MTIFGNIVDEKGNPIEGATIQLIWLPKNELFGTPTKLDDSTYSAWSDTPAQFSVLFTAPGYKKLIVPFQQLQQVPLVTLHKKIPVVAFILVMGAIMYMRKRGKIGSFDTSDVFTIMMLVGGVIAFSMVKKILESLGIWKGTDTKGLDGAEEDPNSFWSPQFWQNKPSNIPFTYTINTETARNYARQIYNAFGPFNDDEETVIGIFKMCRTQANASFIAYAFQQLYNRDLLKFLRGGVWPQDRLSDNDVADINNYVKRLPKY